MKKSNTKKSVQIETNRSTNMIPSEKPAVILENNLIELLEIVKLLQKILRTETLKLERMLRERIMDRDRDGRL